MDDYYMMKKTLLFIFIILLILSISTVNATNSGDVISENTENNNTIILSNDNAQKTMTDLQNTIKNNKDTTFFLNDDYQWGEQDRDLENGIIIDKSIIIDGQGHKIDANHKMRIFQGTNNAIVTFKNINFLNGWTDKGGYGGAVWNNGAKTITIVNCIFNGNTAYYGGAISGCGDNVKINNCTFNGNTATYGGAIYIAEDYAYRYIYNNLDGTFINNAAGWGGAIYILGGDFHGNLYGTFINNKAIFGDGGAIYIAGGVSGNLDGTFINNKAIFGDGGAISIGKIPYYEKTNKGTIIGDFIWIGGVSGHLKGTFINNTARNDGGAIYINGEQRRIILDGMNYWKDRYTTDGSGDLTGTFVNNTAEYGGAISIGGVSGDLTGNFINNIANFGGAINIHRIMKPLDPLASQKSLKAGRELYICAGGVSGHLTGNFINNIAKWNGGAIFIDGGVSGNLDGTYVNNTANYGGVIYIDRGDFTLNIKTILGVPYKVIYTNNGGVSGHLTGTYINNTANCGGGVIYMENCGVSGHLTGNFINNTANHGGVIYLNSGGVSGKLNGTYINNTATNNGSAIYIIGGFSGHLTGNFINNTAEYGGAIYIIGGVSRIKSPGHKGGFFNIWQGDVSGHLTGTFINNTARDDGGAISISNIDFSGKLNGTFINNTARDDGGALYIMNIGFTGHLTGTYINNTAHQWGGAIYIACGSISRVGIHSSGEVSGNLDGGIFINNKAIQGGAIYIKDGGVIHDCIFINNTHTFGTESGSIKAINCWFGNDATNYNTKPNMDLDKAIIDNWLFLNATANTTKLNEGETSTITFKLDSYNDISKQISPYNPPRNLILDLTQTLGELNKNNASIGENILYTARKYGNGSVTGKFETILITINLKINNIRWYVNGSKNSSGDGKSETTAFKTLKEAINKAIDNNTILIASGEYKRKDNINLTIKENLNFMKLGDGEVIFDAEGLSRIWTVTATSINITGLIFKNGNTNGSTLEEKYGGAIYFKNNLTNYNINATFINNTAKYGDGGAIYISMCGVSGNLGGTYINNTAKYGGAIYIHNGAVSGNLTGTYINNTANYHGGAIYMENGVSGNLGGTYINNTAKRYGGAIFILFNHGGVSGNLGGTYINNTAKEYGGAIYIGSGGVSGNLGGTYINNTANTGGAIYINMHSVSGNLGGTYINNTAKEYGGAIYINSGGVSGNLTGIYINNTAKYGGAIYIKEKIGVIRDCIFINNGNTTISTESGNVTTINCWFGNNATNYNQKPTNVGNVTIDNWLFLNATANLTKFNVGETSTITFKLDSYNDISKKISSYNTPINLILDLTQILGELNKNNASIGENILYTARKYGNGSVTGKFETISCTINLKINNIWYVNESKTSSGDGKSETTAFKTLKEAINKAIDSNTILIASGEYKGKHQ